MGILTWPRRRWLATSALAPILAVAYAGLAGVSARQVSPAWVVLWLAAALVGAAVLGSYLPAVGWRPDVGCSACAAMSGLTVVGAGIVFETYGAMAVAPGLAMAISLFGLAQRLGDGDSCASPSGRDGRKPVEARTDPRLAGVHDREPDPDRPRH